MNEYHLESIACSLMWLVRIVQDNSIHIELHKDECTVWLWFQSPLQKT